MVGRGLRGFEFLFERGFGYCLFDIRHRRIFKYAGRIAVAVADYQSAGNFFCVLVHSGELDRQIVRERHVSVETIYENRIVGCRGVDHRGSRQIVRRPIFVVPLPTEYPATFRQMGGKILDPLDEFLRRFRASQIDRR